MKSAQYKSLSQCIYLIEKSRRIHYYEPMSSTPSQNSYVDYLRRLMDHIEARTMEKWEVDSHLWALHKTLDLRIKEIEWRTTWKKRTLN